MLARAGRPRGRYRRWTEAEDDIIRRHYPGGFWRACAPHLPYRNADEIKNRASFIKACVRRHWTRTEDKRLAVMWDLHVSMGWIARELRRSEASVYRRAIRIGLQVGIPEGCESLNAARKRTGYTYWLSLRRILDWAGVVVHVTRSDPHERSVKLRRHYVDPHEVDEAIAKWHATETVHGAARARGMCGVTLRQWLLKAGAIEARASRANITHRRVPTEVIDRVVAEHRSEQ